MTESLEYDVAIVGAGPAGLAAAIRIKQIRPEISVCILEKGSEVGAHIMSGAVLEPRALDELLPDWREKDGFIHTPVTDDKMLFLTGTKSFVLPHLPAMNNKGNYVISLSSMCRWLAEVATGVGVDIFPGFPAAEVLFGANDRVIGVKTADAGVAKDGSHKAAYQPGVEVRAKYTLIGEGARGFLAEKLMKKFGLRAGRQPQTYGLGVKELWEVKPEAHNAGSVLHTVGWPLGGKAYGGGFIYHLSDNLVSVGLITGLDYHNPYLDPFREMQSLKTHPALIGIFEGGKRIAYGARVINEGGWQSIPNLVFPGGALIGCSAGFVNVVKIKGIHNAMKSGMLAAEAVASALENGVPEVLHGYAEAVRGSWIDRELKAVRNVRPAFRAGLAAGILYGGADQLLLRGRAPWTFSHASDHENMQKASEAKKIEYAKPDGVLTFDRTSSVYLSGTNHEHDQPCHLKLKKPELAIENNWKLYESPEQRFCPAGVYEVVEDAGGKKLQINAQNCVHCKTCEIKDPNLNIEWTLPEGGGGPLYLKM